MPTGNNKNSSKLFAGMLVYITEDDQKLMEYVQAGHSKAFERLFAKYKDRIFSFIFQMIKDEAKAEDLTQDVFMKVYKSKDTYDPKFKFSTWIFTIARNCALDYLKKKKEVLPGVSSEEGNMVEEFADDSVDIEMDLVRKSDHRIVGKCFEKLSLDQREALSLRIFSENSYEEIAEIQQKSLAAIKSLINRAKKALHLCVQECVSQS